MSLDIPIMSQQNIPVQNMGEDFTRFQEQNRNRGMINPIIMDAPLNKFNTITKMNLSGIPRQDLILDGVPNSSEYTQYSANQARQFVAQLGNKPLSRYEKTIYSTPDYNLDPSLYRQLLQSKSDSPNVFKQKQSKTYVKDIQTSNVSYDKEKNLYLRPQERISDLLGTKGKGGLSSQLGRLVKGTLSPEEVGIGLLFEGLKYVAKEAQSEQAEQETTAKEQVSRREKEVPKTTFPQENFKPSTSKTSAPRQVEVEVPANVTGFSFQKFGNF
jgi:hypothetical protein